MKLSQKSETGIALQQERQLSSREALNTSPVKCQLLSMTSQRQTSITTSTEQSKAIALRNSYAPSQITAEYSVDLQTIAMSACPTIDCCQKVNSPTLGTLSAAYPAIKTKEGQEIESTAIKWMQGQLLAVCAFVNVNGKMSDWQLNTLCQQIIADHPTITMMEFVLFCSRLRSGQYCSFYGTIDPLLILKAFSDFMEDRKKDYWRKSEDDRKAKEERDAEEARKNAISWEEYCKRHGKKDTTHPFDRIKEKFEKKAAPKPKKVETAEEIMKQAKWLVSETFEKVRETYSALFEKKHGCTPQEYIERNADK